MRWPCTSWRGSWSTSLEVRRAPVAPATARPRVRQASGRSPRAAALAALLALVLAGCSGTPERELGEAAYDRYPDPADVPLDLALLPDAEPRPEPRSRSGNSPEYEVFGQRYRTLHSSQGFEETGHASWYGTRFHGRPTASGEPYDMYAMTAAHKSLPLPSFVEVVNLENDKRVVVRVNDRGPFVDDRIIDLSYAAAHRLGMVEAGTAQVRIRAVEPAGGEAPPAATHTGDNGNGNAAGARQYVQVGAFAEREAAERMRDDLRGRGFELVEIAVLEEPGSRRLHRVRIGPLADDAELRAITERLQRATRLDYRVVRD